MKASIFLTAVLATTLAYAQESNTTLANNATDIRAIACTSTINICNLACNGTAPLINTCDVASQKWNCQCPAGVNQTVLDSAFPIAFRECQQTYMDCSTECVKSKVGTEMHECAETCVKDYKCGTADAPEVTSKLSGNDTKDGEEEEEIQNGASSLGSSAASMIFVAAVYALL